MQTKVLIGTIAFMLTMVILAFAMLNEPARLEEASAAYEGRLIENGAAIFTDSCATCHGIEGKSQLCYDVTGNEIGCAGLPLNSTALLCGEPSERMSQLSWAGSKRSLVYTTIASGRAGTLMPTWFQDFGGPMQQNQVEEVTSFVMNWAAGPALCGEGGAVPTVEWPNTAADLPAGNAAAGAELFVRPYACGACHGDPAKPGSNLIGPGLADIAIVAASRESGKSAADYLFESILDPNAFIAPECASGNPCVSPSQMRGDYASAISDEQDLADLIAYLLELNG